MSSFKTKKRLMYTTFAFIFLFGGIEYAVILPTLWLYLHNTYDPPEYMLGLVLSAYSLAAFISAPFFGRLSDKFHCTKQIFLICSMFEMVGSFLYFIGVSEWLCVASRFISGLGAASEAIAVAEVSRYTTEQERTGIISNLIATRQIALLLGPALNLFLRLADFKLGPFSVTKYSAPGAFMVVMWVLLMLVVVLLYTEPRLIFAETQAASGPGEAAINGQTYSQAGADVSRRKVYAYTQSNDFLASDDGSDIVYPPLSSEKPFGLHNYEDMESSGEMYHEIVPEEKGVSSTPQTSQINTGDNGRERRISKDYHESRGTDEKLRLGTSSSRLYPGLKDNDHGDDKHRFDTKKSEVELEASDNFHDPWTSSLPGTEVDLSSSVEILATAERLINHNQWSASEKAEKAYGANSGHLRASLARAVAADAGDDLFFYDNHFSHSVSEDHRYSYGSQFDADERTALLGNTSTRHTHQNGAVINQPGENDPYIERSLTALDDPVSREGKLGFCCNEYIRDEIVAILCLLFCAMFSQICVETMVLPLSLKYLDFGELENSLLYCMCGVEIIIVFLVMTRLSRCLSDRVMLMFGAVMILFSNMWLLYFLPTAPPHDRAHNIPMFGVAVVLDVLSLPFLIVCATSLYSKLTRKQTQGLSQGLRRAIVSVGTIMAPMWGSSASTKPDLLIGVLVALQGLSLVLCIFSYPRLKASTVSSQEGEHRPSQPLPPQPSVVLATTPDIVDSTRKAGGGGGGGGTEADYEESQDWVEGASINSHPVDQSRQQTPSATEGIFYECNSPRDRAVSGASGFLTPYGSVERSPSGTSFLSVRSHGSGSRRLQPSPLL